MRFMEAASGHWSDRIAQLIATAEAEAERLRAEAERRADERIAEADRAAQYRVEAAEAEALEILDRANTESHAAAERGAEEAERIRKAADEYATLVRANAQEEARGLTREARFAAQAVLTEGGQLHDDLQELSKSMRRNAERLINDVRDAHARLAGEIDRTVGAEPAASGRQPRRARVDFGDDVPEFMP
jgi:cell division septum initiation protein DivIVA